MKLHDVIHKISIFHFKYQNDDIKLIGQPL